MDNKRYFDLTASLKQALGEYQYNLHIDIEEDSEEEDDDLKPEYVCPFCFEDFDLLGFCCHMDNGHPTEVKSGICPVCAKKVGINMAVHIITQHGSILNALYKKRPRNGGSLAALSLLQKRSEEEYDNRYVEKTSSVVSSSGIAADPMLSSLIYNAPAAVVPEIQQSSSTTEVNVAEESSDKNSLGRIIPSSPLSNKDQEEKARRCEFVQGLLYSTFLDNGL